MDKIAEKLKAWRASAGIHQEDAAEKAGVHQSTISRVEQGRQAPSVELLATLARVYGVGAAELAELLAEIGEGR